MGLHGIFDSTEGFLTIIFLHFIANVPTPVLKRALKPTALFESSTKLITMHIHHPVKFNINTLSLLPNKLHAFPTSHRMENWLVFSSPLPVAIFSAQRMCWDGCRSTECGWSSKSLRCNPSQTTPPVHSHPTNKHRWGQHHWTRTQCIWVWVNSITTQSI